MGALIRCLTAQQPRQCRDSSQGRAEYFRPKKRNPFSKILPSRAATSCATLGAGGVFPRLIESMVTCSGKSPLAVSAGWGD